MAIPDYHKKNFEVFLAAAKAERIALVELADAVTGVPRYAICMVSGPGPRGKEQMLYTPVGHFYDSIDPAKFDPFAAYIALGGTGPNGETPEMVRESFKHAAEQVMELAVLGATISAQPDPHCEAAIQVIGEFLTQNGADIT